MNNIINNFYIDNVKTLNQYDNKYQLLNYM